MTRKTTILSLSIFLLLGLLACTKQTLELKSPSVAVSPIDSTLLSTSSNIIDFEVDDSIDPESGDMNVPGLHGTPEKGVYVYLASPFKVYAYYELLPTGKYDVSVGYRLDGAYPIKIYNIKLAPPLISFADDGFNVFTMISYTTHMSAELDRDPLETIHVNFDVRLK